MAVGAFWAWIPGILQAKRGSHIVITTIMFNFIAASLVGYLINYWFRPVGKMAVESREITGAYIMSFREVAREFFGVRIASSPLNFSVFLAIVAAFAVWYLLWRTKLGYEIRAFGANQSAAVYAGIKPDRIIIITMAISGALAGLMAVNEILGVQHRSSSASSAARASSASPWRSWAVRIPSASCSQPCCSDCFIRAARNSPLPSPASTAT
jgi:general nucleoside transport system permease protein